MAFKFRKMSIKSRKRTLGIAGFALVVEMIVSHPRFDVTHVATAARVAGPALMASLATLTRTVHQPDDTVVGVPVVTPVSDHTTMSCAKPRRIES
ncbi:hypothetical protein RPMA_13745 [Tardiphaga alba]|uniref:Secreted protein n=1 Tax=Tardiphaga alba TaxID=340268 RepID=A0ABX8ABH4_9BRAD|nr:hypothetical protein [Tardiphaga alba]QUS39783.1 hypothetical protein RPMA_13745 [Tardiphaga alba]